MKKVLKQRFKRSHNPSVLNPEPGTAAMELNEFDKLYMLLAEENKEHLFNMLCYDLGAAGLADVHNISSSEIKKKCGINKHKAIAEALHEIRPKPEKKLKEIKVNYHKHGYREQLLAKGIPIIEWKDLTFKNKITSGPFAGTVCSAVWINPYRRYRKMSVCLRYDQSSAQRLRFISEAEMAVKLKHENILEVYGAVILGDYAESLALVVELTPYGNMREAVAHHTVHNICNYIAQIAKALEFIDKKGYIHTRISSAFIYNVEREKVKVGGLWGCVSKRERNISELRAHKKGSANRLPGMIDQSMSSDDMIPWFGNAMSSCFEYLEFHKLQRRPWLMNVLSAREKRRGEFGLLCPDVYKPLFRRCVQEMNEERPSLSEICSFVSQRNVPKRVKVMKAFSSDQIDNLQCKEGDMITLISTSLDKTGKWFGEKLGGDVGFFDGSHTTEIALGNETGIASVEAEIEPQTPVEEKMPDLVIPAEILARGPDAEMAYWRALRNGKVRVNRARVMLVGQDRAGKTSLKKSLLGMPFDPYQASTEGVEVDPSVFEVQIDQVTNWQRVEDNKMKSQLDDELARMVAGELKNAPTEPEENGRNEERNQPLATDEDVVESNKEKEIETVEMKSDLASDVETSNVDPIMNDVTTDGPAAVQQIDIKLDISNTVPEHVTERVIQYLQNLKLDEAVDRKETIVTIWDFAGQHLYYASHPVFLSPRAIYVLAYNLSKDLNAKAQPCVRQGVFDVILENTTDETNLENILSWLVSIHNVSVPEDDLANNERVKSLPYMRPPVVIVGTHSDCAHEEPKRAEACIKKSISRKTFGQHVVRPFFVVNNTLSSSDAGVKNLRHKINELLQLEPYMGEDVPIRWFNFEKVTEFLVEAKTSFLDLTKLEQIVREVCLIEDENEVMSMLNFYHDLGVIIKYGKTVVLQAQWLISLFKKLITIRPYDEQDPKFSDHWEELEERGILRPELVDHVFSEFISDGQSREDILNMMELYGLIARFGNNGKEESASKSRLEFKDAKYFVPAQLRSSPDKLLDVQPSEKDPCSLYVHFLDGFLPHGLFPQVVSRFIKWCSVTGCRYEPNLYLNVARFILGHNGTHDLFLIRRKRFIKVVIKTLKLAAADTIQSLDDSISSPGVEARRFLEATLEELSTETPWLRHMRYELAVLCPSCVAPDKQCFKHKQNGCLDDECLHLLGIHYGEPLICTKSYGDSSHVDNINVEAWFTNPPHEEKDQSETESKVAEMSVGTNPTLSSADFKPGTVNREVLMLLAQDIGRHWRRVALALGLGEPELDQIDADEKELYEKSYGMLRKWTQMYASSATFEKLGRALMNVIVGREDLAARYCVRAERMNASKGSGSDFKSLKAQDAVDFPDVATRPPVFISYQWDIQETVKELKTRLEKAGFQCWMDINQMGGGDALNAEIDAGIRASKVVIACVTERYCRSENCQREVTLADLLRIPIIPLLLQPMAWPPAGQLALIFAKLLYIDMTTGSDAKFAELSRKLKQQISR